MSQSKGSLEEKRLLLQTCIDSQKTKFERNKAGQFATPTGLATEMLDYAKTLLGEDKSIRFLDPAFGTGSFFSALLSTFDPSQISQAVAYEIDPLFGEAARQLWEGTLLELRIADFTVSSPPIADSMKANLVICNPPYVRHHHLSPAQKERLQKDTLISSNVKLNGLAGLYCYFLLLAHSWMADGAIAGWLIPSEFMDVNYGRGIKDYLTREVTLLRIHRFNPNEVQFDDALVSSAVLWFMKKKPSRSGEVCFTYGGTLANPESAEEIPLESLNPEQKWTRLSFATRRTLPFSDSEVRLADLFTVKRGLATGSNDFFILNEGMLAKYEIPSIFLTPILPSPRFLKVDEVDADSDGNPVLPQPLYLFHCDLPEETIQKDYPAVWKYLQAGIAQGIDQGYLCKHRRPWYRQEDRPAAPLLCTYMGRNDTQSRRPFRFILNHSNATATNVYLLLYPKPELKSILERSPRSASILWRALNAISPETLLGEGRVYGGGLHKVEPRELGNATIDLQDFETSYQEQGLAKPSLFSRLLA